MPLKIPGTIRRRGERFVARVRLRGYADRQKTFATRDAAEAWITAQHKEMKWAKESRKGQREWSLRHLIGEYLDSDSFKALRSGSDVKRELAWFVNEYGEERALAFVTGRKIKEARNKLREKGTRGPASINRYLAALRSCWNWAISEDHVPASHPWPKRTMLPEPPGRIRYLDDGEIKALLKAAGGDPVLHAALVISISTGVRQGELLKLNWANIDWKRKRAAILYTKTSRNRAVPLTPVALKVLKKLRALPVVGITAVFVQIANGNRLNRWQLQDKFNAAKKVAKIKDCTYHDLRHTCASQLAQNGATLLEIGKLLGHTSPRMTERYAHLIEGEPIKAHAKLDRALRYG